MAVRCVGTKGELDEALTKLLDAGYIANWGVCNACATHSKDVFGFYVLHRDLPGPEMDKILDEKEEEEG